MSPDGESARRMDCRNSFGGFREFARNIRPATAFETLYKDILHGCKVAFPDQQGSDMGTPDAFAAGSFAQFVV